MRKFVKVKTGKARKKKRKYKITSIHKILILIEKPEQKIQQKPIISEDITKKTNKILQTQENIPIPPINSIEKYDKRQ